MRKRMDSLTVVQNFRKSNEAAYSLIIILPKIVNIKCFKNYDAFIVEIKAIT